MSNQMSVQAVQTEILEPMQQLFLPPRQMDLAAQQAALRGYALVLANFDTRTLKAAWIDVVASHTSRAWPVPAVLVNAAKRVLKDARTTNNEHREPYAWEPQNVTLNRQNWERIRGSQMAREAANAECSWSLKCQAMNDGRRAEQIDIRELISDHHAAVRLADSLEAGGRVYDRFRGKSVAFSARDRVMALKMWRHLLVREAETAEELRRAG